MRNAEEVIGRAQRAITRAEETIQREEGVHLLPCSQEDERAENGQGAGRSRRVGPLAREDLGSATHQSARILVERQAARSVGDWMLNDLFPQREPYVNPLKGSQGIFLMTTYMNINLKKFNAKRVRCSRGVALTTPGFCAYVFLRAHDGDLEVRRPPDSVSQ
ncbi:hypothetical protein PGT21_002300 [Puccinia graminis f. sp. tritici]|uniref:Uncharacterized protein n=1 Tax=Puccinia graminis f. sp. tritici TaxID=56615 RepID=A0A5B0QZG4_PUCGR|nr:hypothetical protein PGT21_002300 [Puccinia graminis f. sp. tritici]